MCIRDSKRADQPFSLSYQPSIPAPQGADWADVSPAEGETHIRAALAAARSEDYKNYCTTIGPHRDNMEVTIAGISARNFGSQGQQRSVVLSLKMAEAAAAAAITGEHPVLLLDDVLSELDDGRKQYLLTRMREKQTFVTSCDDTAFLKTDGEVYRMNGGVLSKA